MDDRPVSMLRRVRIITKDGVPDPWDLSIVDTVTGRELSGYIGRIAFDIDASSDEPVVATINLLASCDLTMLAQILESDDDRGDLLKALGAWSARVVGYLGMLRFEMLRDEDRITAEGIKDLIDAYPLSWHGREPKV